MTEPDAAPSPRALPAVSVIMPARNAEQTLTDAVSAVLAQTYEGGTELIIADGGGRKSTEIAAELAKRHPEVRVVANPARTTPAGLNAALAAATGTVIARCDAGAVLPPDYLARAIARLQDTAADNVGGRQVPVGSGFWGRAIAAALQNPIGVGDARFRLGGPPGPVDTVYLGVFRRELLDRLGGFDETFVRNQDYELNVRIRAGGGIVYFDPDLEVDYHVRPTLGALARQYFGYGAGRRRTVQRHPQSLRPRQLAPPLLVVGLLASAAAAVAGAGWPALVVPAAYLGALAVGTGLALPKAGRSALAVPVVLATMHGAWGAGFLVGRSAFQEGARQE